MSETLDLRGRAGRRLWIGIPGPTVDDATKRHLEEVRPGGIVLFRRNIASLEQVRSLVRTLRGLLGRGLLVSTDQEGGLVARFHRELTSFPGNMALGAAGFREPSLGEHLAEEQGLHMGRELRDLGIDVDLAPVLDRATRGDNPGIHVRSFGESPELVARLGRAMVRGLARGGVHPCLKHFPGLGEATVDSHLDLPRVGPDGAEDHLAPFRAGIDAGAPLVMTSHAVYEAFDATAPATLSPRVVLGLLRGDLGFRGVIVTDDLEMGALRSRFEFAATIRGASAAGHDVLCVCGDVGLQREAAAVLRSGLEEGAPWYGDPLAMESRLERLVVPTDPGAPDPSGASAVAEAIAGRAISVVRDDRRLLPLRQGEKALLVIPTLRGETPVEDPLRGEDDARELAESLGDLVEVHGLPARPSAMDVVAMLQRAREYRKLLLVLTNARFLPAQAEMARAAVAEHPGAIVLPIRNPFDLDVLPVGSRFTAVASYGFRPVQLRALARVLAGGIRSYGRLPITLKASTP